MKWPEMNQSSMMQEQKKELILDLELDFFKMANLVGLGAVFYHFLSDLILFKNYPAVLIESVALVVFVTFFFLGRWKKHLFRKLVIPFITMINLILVSAYLLLGGLYEWVVFLLFYIFILSFLISPERIQKYLIACTGFLLAGFIILDLLYFHSRRIPDINPTAVPTYILYILVLFILGSYLILMMKRSYEKLATQLVETRTKSINIKTHLEDIVRERTHRLDQMNHELDTHFYRSSHDLRRPITTLMGVNLMARQVPMGNPEYEQMISCLEQTVDRMQNLISSHQTIYIVNNFQKKEKSDSLNRYLLNLKNRVTANPGNRFIYNISLNKYPDTDARNDLIFIILENLVENSLEFTHQGFAEIMVDIYETVEDLVISYTDRGIGIEENRLEKIFDLHYKAHDHSKGFGMGLYIVKLAVEKLGGFLDVNSRVNEYTRFEIHISLT